MNNFSSQVLLKDILKSSKTYEGWTYPYDIMQKIRKNRQNINEIRIKKKYTITK